MKTEKGETTNVGIRMPVDLVERLKELAEKETRTLSQQVIYVLKRYLDETQQTSAGRK